MENRRHLIVDSARGVKNTNASPVAIQGSSTATTRILYEYEDHCPIAAGVLLAMAGAAQAATKSTTFQVTATVAENCVRNRNITCFRNL